MAKNFYQDLKKDINYSSHLDNLESLHIQNFEFINRNLTFPMRYYKEEALFTLQYFLDLPSDNYFKKALLEEIGDKKIPFMGFEIATGAGKTSIIGANMLYLYKRGYKNFLIITPNTFIYEKTIRNFSVNDKKCVFSEEIPLKINLITGENYKDRTCEYDEDADITIYVFNIQKFFEKNSGNEKKQDESSGVPYVLRPLEESFWKDDSGNTISFVDFLRKRNLVIFTDEAHHYQNDASSEAIKQMDPELVLEYTATAIENHKEKREQKVIYKYSISQFIEDKYAKKIRAIGYANLHESKSNQVSEADKRKIILSLLCHLVKREALKDEKLKPLTLIRSRHIEHSQNVLKYLQEDISKDILILEEVIEIIKNEKSPITKIFLDLFDKMGGDKEKLLIKLAKIALLSFRIDSDVKSDSEIVDKWNSIEENEYEFVVYVKMLDEGIDVNNIYILTILSDSDSTVKNNIKQIIGRGVRLYKEKREFDNETNIKKQSENLYIVCDKDRNFENFIESIRSELELSKDQFDRDENWDYQTIIDEPKIEKIIDLDISILSVLQKDKDKIQSILELIEKSSKAINLFIEELTYDGNGKRIIKEIIDVVIDERSLDSKFSKGTLTIAETEEKELKLSELEINSLVSDFILDFPSIPDHEDIRKKLRNLIKDILSKNIFYKTKFGYDETIAKSSFYKKFLVIFGNFIEKQIFDEKAEITSKKLKDIFKNRNVEIAKSKNEADWNLGLSLLSTHFVDTYFTGYKYSLYKYVNFDSKPEKTVANLLEEAMEKENDIKNFWIKNARRGEYTITISGKGEHSYNPDFIVFFKGKFYIIEVKGNGIYYEEFKKRRNDEKLVLLEEQTENIKSILLMSEDIDHKFNTVGGNFNLILSYNRLLNETNKQLSSYK